MSPALAAEVGRDRTVALGSGMRVPYPTPTSAAASSVGRANRRSDTKPERILRSELHCRGLRFRKDLLVRAGDVLTHPDVVFTRARIAVFVDGCFWHGCPEHGSTPRSNVDYWVPKLTANQERDRRVDQALGDEGWLVLRFWEHEPVEGVADLVRTIYRQRIEESGRSSYNDVTSSG